MSAISPHHQDEIAKFLKFFRSRLKNHLENVEADFEDTRSDRLSSDDVYSQKDVQSALSSLCFAVQANVRSELQDSIHMMALLLRQIFVEAENSKLALELDIGQVEDKELLEKVEKLSVAEWADEETTAATKSKQLGSKKAHASVSPAALLQQQMQKQHDEELRQARRTHEQQQDDHARELKATQRKLFEAQDKIDELSFKLEDMQKHISQTKQFQSMKTMVAQKNTQLLELRRRLKRYEPDDDDADAQDDDDDDDGGKRND